MCYEPTVLDTLPALQQVQLSVLDDGTLAIEANVDELLGQWPYLSDLSLIWSVASIFQPVVVDDQADPAHQAAAAAASKVLQGEELQPWLYFNLIAHNSHMFVPVTDIVSLHARRLLVWPGLLVLLQSADAPSCICLLRSCCLQL